MSFSFTYPKRFRKCAEFPPNNKADLTLHSRLVLFGPVDAILQLSELLFHFLKNHFNFLVWPCIEAVVDVVTTPCC